MSAIPFFVRQNGILGLLMWHTGWSSLVSMPWNGYGSHANMETFELLSKCNGRREIGGSLYSGGGVLTQATGAEV